MSVHELLGAVPVDIGLDAVAHRGDRSAAHGTGLRRASCPGKADDLPVLRAAQAVEELVVFPGSILALCAGLGSRSTGRPVGIEIDVTVCGAATRKNAEDESHAQAYELHAVSQVDRSGASLPDLARHTGRRPRYTKEAIGAPSANPESDPSGYPVKQASRLRSWNSNYRSFRSFLRTPLIIAPGTTGAS